MAQAPLHQDLRPRGGGGGERKANSCKIQPVVALIHYHWPKSSLASVHQCTYRHFNLGSLLGLIFAPLIGDSIMSFDGVDGAFSAIPSPDLLTFYNCMAEKNS